MSNRFTDYTTKDYEGFRTDLIELLKVKIPEYSDFSQSDAGIVLIELLSHGLDIVSYYNDIVSNEVFMDTARNRSSVINLTNQIGYTMQNATASRFEQVFKIIPEDEPFTIEAGTQVSTLGSEVEEAVIFELEEDLIIPANKTGIEQDAFGNYLYKGIVKHGVTVTEEVLGTSKGVPDQSFQLGYTKALDNSIIIYVDEGNEWVIWDKVESFIDSEGIDRDYMIKINDLDETRIIFGNDLSGKIPPPYSNGIVASYRIGGGIEGNVAANKITEMPTKLARIEETFNPKEALEFGKDKEDNHTAKIRATAQLRTLWRAVTIFDFEDLAHELDYVKFASAIERDITIVSENGYPIVDVYVLSKERDILTTKEKEGLEELYDNRKLIGVDVEVHSAQYVTVDFSIHVKILENYWVNEITDTIQTFMRDKFKVGNIRFGEEINLSKIVGELVMLDGIRSISFISPVEDIELEPHQIIKLGNVTIETVGGLNE